MDPALHEYIFSEAHEAEIEAIVRLVRPDVLPAGLKAVAQFGDIATCRLAVGRVEEVWGDEAVLSLKAPRLVLGEPEELPVTEGLQAASPAFTRSHPGTFTGKGVALGVIDWGFDFTHPNFIDPQTGSTRFLSIWDQTAPAHPSAGKYGYGRIYSREEINAALNADAPFSALGYNPVTADLADDGAHGTHVLDIAAGNGSVGEPGMAPGTDIIGVHLSAGYLGGLANLGDSVRILEAIDFLAGIADAQALVINMSVGKHGGSHQGNSLVEQGMDNFLREKPGRAIINSAGNYYSADIHASGRIAPGHSTSLKWEVDKSDITPNELEIWYPGKDEFILSVKPPGDKYAPYVVKLGDKMDIAHRKETAGRIYHRKSEPNTGHHHIDIFLYRNAPKGIWEITLEGVDVVDGRFHAWIERDSGCLNCQSRFVPEDADPQYTTGSICNGLYTIAVGAFDPNDPNRRPASFSSSGPTADGRQKPNLLAPGVNIRAARSAPAGAIRSAGELTAKTGTSMAAPHVAGAVACLFEAARQLLPIETTRRLLLENLEAHIANTSGVNYQFGLGVLDIPSMLQSFQARRENRKETEQNTIYPTNENNSAMLKSIGFVEQQVNPTPAADLRLVLDGNAIIRTPPPDLWSIGRRLAQYSLVEVTLTQTHRGQAYARVSRPARPGAQGASQALGWTLESNLESNDAATINWATVKSELVRIANREYDAWNVPNITFEINSRNFPAQKAYWGTVGVRPTDAQLGDNVWQNGQNGQGGHYWSAAFISYVVQQSGAGTHFCYNASHSCYIVCARRNREYNSLQNPFWAYPIDDPIAAWPEPGDIVCKNRNGGVLTLDSINCGNNSHCDIVVSIDRERQQMITIGGNVDSRVARRIVRLTPQGFIDSTQLWEVENAGTRQQEASIRSQNQYFAIIKVRTNIAALPAVAAGRGGADAEGNDSSAVEALVMATHADSWGETATELEADDSGFEEEEGIDTYTDDDVADDFESYENLEAQETDFETWDEEYEELESYPQETGYADCGCGRREREQRAMEMHHGQHENCRGCGEFWLEQAREAFVNPLIGFSARSNDAARLFDAIAYGKGSNIAAPWQERYRVEYAPRTVVRGRLLPGDILVERSFGDGKGHISLITTGELQTSDTLSDSRLKASVIHPGYFVEVLDGARSYARRITDGHGRLSASSIVLRPQPVLENSDYATNSNNWAEDREAEIAALKNQVAITWGNGAEVVDPVFYMLYPEWEGKSCGSLAQADKSRCTSEWKKLANELIGLRKNLAMKGQIVPAVGGSIVPLGFKRTSYTDKNNRTTYGLKPDPNYQLYQTGRLDVRLAELHRQGKINISQDELDIFQRIANVESGGQVHTLNTYDRAVVTIGFMQFTLHVGKIQEWIKLNESAFKRYGIQLDTSQKYRIEGYDSTAIKGVAPSQVDQLRWNGWAERFYYAGLDEDIIIAQVELAKKYLNTHLIGLKSKLKDKHNDVNHAKYLLFKSRYYDKDAYVRGLFQESYNNNPTRSASCVSNALDNLDDGNTSVAHFLEKYKEQLISKYHRKKKNQDGTLATNPDGSQIYERGLVEKAATGTSIVLEKSASEQENYWIESGAPCNSYNCWVQESLNALMAGSLTVNGRINSETRELIRQFQQQQGIGDTGIIDTGTERRLLEARARYSSPANATALRLNTTAEVLSEASRRIIDYTAHVPLTACMDRIDDARRRLGYDYRRRRADQRDPRLIKSLVLHQMAFIRSSQTAEAHKCVNSHFIILRDGSIHQLHPVSAHLWASHGFNPRSVAVEFAGHFRNERGGGPDIPTQAQYEAGRFLVKYLVHLLGIDKVLTHRQSSNKSGDPGPDIWYHVGEWSMQNLGITDTTQVRIGDGSIIPQSWRIWGQRSGSLAAEARVPQPLQTQCGFFGASTIAVPRATLVQELQTIVTDARTRWLSNQNRLLLENQHSQFPFLLIYRLSVVSSIPTQVFQDISANALSTNYSIILSLPAGNTQRRRQEVVQTRITLFNGLNLTNAPANLNTLVENAIVNALDSYHNDDNNGAWSAAFISFCVRSAAIRQGIESSQNGIYNGENELLVVSNRHTEFLVAAYLRRLGNSSQRRSGTYHAFPANTTSIDVGDIIVQDRHASNIGGVTSFANIPRIGRRRLHSDIVVEVNSDHVVAIGGNLGQSVRRRRFPLDANGNLIIDEATLYSQENDNGVLPLRQTNPAQGLHSSSTRRIFAVLKLWEACVLMPPGQPVPGGVIV